MLIIILGAGTVGFSIAKKLTSENMDVVVIDNHTEALSKVEENLDAGVIHGNASSPDILRKAGIERAEMLVATTSSDEVNMIACLFGAKVMPPGAVRIARVRNDNYLTDRPFTEAYLDSINLCINPERLVAEKIIRLLSVPAATDVVEFAEGNVQIIGLPVRADSNLVGVKVKDLRNIYPDQKVLFAAIVRGGGVLIPGGDDVVMARDRLFAVTEPSRINDVLRVTGHQFSTLRRVAIAGNTRIAMYLAEELSRVGVQIKLINPNLAQCNHMAERFNDKVIVLHGDGTDLGLLEQENIGESDAFVAAGTDDEDNVLTALLVYRLGCKRTMVVVNKASYAPIIQAVGVHAAISTHQAAVSSILQYIRRGRVLQVSALGDEAEAIEFEAAQNSPLVDKPLARAHFPKGAVVAAIVRSEGFPPLTTIGSGSSHIRPNSNSLSHSGNFLKRIISGLEGGEHTTITTAPGQIIIPNGSDVVHPKDRVIVFAMKNAIGAVERALTGNLKK